MVAICKSIYVEYRTNSTHKFLHSLGLLKYFCMGEKGWRVSNLDTITVRRLQDQWYLKTLTLTLKIYSVNYFNSLAILGLAFLNIVF